MKAQHKPDEKELAEIVALILQEVELRFKRNKPLPTRADLMKIITSAYEITIQEALNCIKTMEQTHKKNLEKMGYVIKN